MKTSTFHTGSFPGKPFRYVSREASLEKFPVTEFPPLIKIFLFFIHCLHLFCRDGGGTIDAEEIATMVESLFEMSQVKLFFVMVDPIFIYFFFLFFLIIFELHIIQTGFPQKDACFSLIYSVMIRIVKYYESLTLNSLAIVRLFWETLYIYACMYTFCLRLYSLLR